MREIKFRANRFGLIGKVVEINFISPEKGYDYLIEDSKGNQIREWGKNLDIMQYTGLKDKNGKEIYEGDIVKLPYWEDCKNYISVVEWGYMGWDPYVNTNPDYDTTSAEFSTIIGNIYENPELLEDK